MNDVAFKAVFGSDNPQSKAALLAFLNRLLDSGLNRSLFYSGALQRFSLSRGESYDRMKKSILINILDGVLFPERKSSYGVYTYRERESGEELSDMVQLHYLELGKISWETPVEELSIQERLGAYLKYATDPERREYIEELRRWEGEVISLTENTIDQIDRDRELLDMIFSRQFYHDLARWQESERQYLAEERGMERGMEKGMEQGKVAEKLQIATAMKARGIDAEVIAACTGLSGQQIEEL